MAAEIVFRDNADEVLKELDSAVAKALFDIGSACQGYTQDNTPRRTGALASSWTVEIDEGDNSVTIGVPKGYSMNGQTPGEYAIFVEAGSRNNRANNMLRNAATQHSDEYKQLTKQALDNG